MSVRLLPRGQANQWEGGSQPEVTAGRLRIGKELNMFQLLLKEWFWTCLVIGTSIIAVAEGMILLVLRVVLLEWLEIRQERLAQEAQRRQEEEAGAQYPHQQGMGPFSVFDNENDDEWQPMGPAMDDHDGQGNGVDVAGIIDVEDADGNVTAGREQGDGDGNENEDRSEPSLAQEGQEEGEERTESRRSTTAPPG